MRQFRIWETGVYEVQVVKAETMHSAVSQFAGVQVLHLSGFASLSTKNNTVRFIASDGSARQFTCYEVREEL